jgi:predicted DNA-binding transcriptional regulator AlpA
MMSDRWVTTEGAANHTGFAVSTLEKLRCYGGGARFAKIAGRSVRYRVSDLDEWMAANVVSSTSELKAA